MSKLSSLTENRYTLNDIFAKKYQVWMMIPLFIYLLTPVVHMIVYGSLYEGTISGIEEIVLVISTGEMPGDYYRSICACAFAFGAVFTLIGFISLLSFKKQNKAKISADSIPLFIFIALLVLVVISSVVNKTDYSYIMGYTLRAEGLVTIFAYFLVMYFSGSVVTKENYKYAAMYFFVLLSVALAVLTLIDNYVYDIGIIKNNNSIFYHFNFYAYFLTIAIMLCASLAVLDPSRVRSAFAAAVMCLNTLTLAINNSFGGFLACIVAFLFLIVAASIKQKKFSFLSVVMFAAFMLITFLVGLEFKSFFSEFLTLGKDVEKIATNASDAGSAGTARWGLWKATMGYIREKPYIGWGIEGTVGRLAADTGQEKVHNEYLDYMVEYGIPAGLIYIAGLVSIFIKALKRRKFVDNATLCCLVASLGYIGSAFFGNRMVFITPFFFIFLGLANSTVGATAQPVTAEPQVIEQAPDDDAPSDNSEPQATAQESEQKQAEQTEGSEETCEENTQATQEENSEAFSVPEE